MCCHSGLAIAERLKGKMQEIKLLEEGIERLKTLGMLFCFFTLD